MAQLLDPHGQPITAAMIAKLRQPQAGATLAGVRPVMSGNPADGMTPRRLAAIHRAAANGESLAYMELAEDIEERDLHYAGVLSTRKRQVSQIPITVEAASPDAEHVKHAAFVADWLKTGVLQLALFDMLDAIGKAYSVCEIDWEVTAQAILPRALTWRSQRWFEVSRADGETVLLRDLTALPPAEAVASGLPGIPAGLVPGQIGLAPLIPWKFVVHRHKAKSGILLRAGLARLASWAWMYKAFTLRDWAVFVQNYGMPIRVGRYGPEANDEEKGVLWSAVANIAGDCAAIIPKSMTIDFQEMGNLQAGADIYQRRADWLDAQISKAVLGQTATTDASPGSHAAGRTHRLVQEDIERSDAMLLSASLTQQLVQPIVAFNFAGTTAFPQLLIGRPDELPIKEVVGALQWLGPQGLTVSAKQVRERLGFDEPEEGEDVIGGKPPPPAPLVVPPQLLHKAEPDRGPEPEPGDDPATERHAQLPLLLARHARLAASAVDPELIDLMTQRLALDAQTSLAGLTGQVLHQIDAADSLEDLAQRLAGLKLNTEQYVLAMQRALAVAHLAGQAALLDEIAGGR